MISIYRPGTSPLHRLPPGIKLIAVMFISIALGIWGHEPVMLGCATILAIALYLLAGFGAGEIFRQLVALRWVIVLVWASQMAFQALGPATASLTRLTLILLLATLLTLTTPAERMLDAIERWLGFLRPLGVRPERIALLLALTISSIPVIAGFHAQITEAQRARGARASLHRSIVPLLVLAMRHADELAEAIAARGVRY